jgi:manganese efflux pump family protein
VITVPLALLALALAADAFAVAISQGATVRSHPWRRALIVGLAFGVAQAIAPLIGWSLGRLFADLIESVDHWIAFGLLAFIGGKMLLEGLRHDPPGPGTEEEPVPSTSGLALAGLAVATAIDAVAAGITLPTLGVPILISVAVIGLVTFALSAAGVWIGRMGAKTLGSKAEILGGVVLIGIGVKVLIDHHAFG